TTATTQSPLDNSTKLGTTAYTNAAVGVETTRAEAAEAGKGSAGQGFAVSGGVGTTTGVTTSQIPFGNQNALTASMQIAVVPSSFAFTIPTNGVISSSTTMR